MLDETRSYDDRVTAALAVQADHHKDALQSALADVHLLETFLALCRSAKPTLDDLRALRT